MPQNDIDKILEDIKKRRERAQASQTAKPAVEPEKPAAPVITEEKPVSAPVIETRISEKDKATLSRFINNTPEPQPESFASAELDTQFENTDYVSKKSEDYIDENFMKFFTQSVIVTKTPEETEGVQVKRKKGGFFKRKYITDSLSLNIETLEEEEEKVKSVIAKTYAYYFKHTDKLPLEFKNLLNKF